MAEKRKFDRTVRQYLGTDAAEAGFLSDFIAKNLREMRAGSRTAVRCSDWDRLDRYAAAVLALGENLEIPQLMKAGQALLACLDRRDAERVKLVVQKTNLILQTLMEKKATNEEPGGENTAAE